MSINVTICGNQRKEYHFEGPASNKYLVISIEVYSAWARYEQYDSLEVAREVADRGTFNQTHREYRATVFNDRCEVVYNGINRHASRP